jgi:hypothetical protein
MKQNEWNDTYDTTTAPPNTIDKYEYLQEIANEYIYDIQSGEQCCVYTRKMLRLILNKLPYIYVEWNDKNECYCCWK